MLPNVFPVTQQAQKQAQIDLAPDIHHRLQQQRQENVGERLDSQHRGALGRHFDFEMTAAAILN
jgi:hypothetical protein